MLARKRGGVTPIDTHPTAAIWVRYRNVKDMDGVAIAGTDPANPWSRAVLTARRLATNHFTGWGYWIWFIPLKDGETSVGLVWDKRLLNPRDARRSRSSTRFLQIESPLAPADRGRRRRSRATAATTRTCPTSSTSSSARAGRRSATRAGSSTRSTRRASTRCRSRSGRARGLILKELGGAPADEMTKEYAEHNRRTTASSSTSTSRSIATSTTSWATTTP